MLNTNEQQRKHELLQLLQGTAQIAPPLNQAAETRVQAEAPAADEALLLTRCRDGELAAFAQLLPRYLPAVYTYVRYRVNDAPRAVIVTRAVFVTAWRSMTRYHANISLTVWLFSLAERHLRPRPGAWLHRWTTERDHAVEAGGETAGSATCAKIQELFSPYLDGVANAVAVNLVEEHLATCDQCGQHFEELRLAREMVHQYGQFPMPEDLPAQILAALQTPSFWQPYRAIWQRFKMPAILDFSKMVPLLASLTAILFVGLWFSQFVETKRLTDRNAELEAQLPRVLRGDAPPRAEVANYPFIILTGKLASDGISPEASRFIADLTSPNPSDSMEPQLILGNSAELAAQITTWLQDLQGQQIQQILRTEQSLRITQITAQLPQTAQAMLTLRLQQATANRPAAPLTPEIVLIPIELYILDLSEMGR